MLKISHVVFFLNFCPDDFRLTFCTLLLYSVSHSFGNIIYISRSCFLVDLTFVALFGSYNYGFSRLEIFGQRLAFLLFSNTQRFTAGHRAFDFSVLVWNLSIHSSIQIGSRPAIFSIDRESNIMISTHQPLQQIQNNLFVVRIQRE